MPNLRTSALIGSIEALRLNARREAAKPPKRAREVWFVGPKAENAALLEDLVTRAVRHNCEVRRDYMPEDPSIYSDDRRHPEAEAVISEELEKVLHCLRGSIPLACHRNVSHMYWDQSLPGVVGYIAALFHNQNNVAAEASPVTTFFELVVGDELCAMLGYPVPPAQDTPPAPDTPPASDRPQAGPRPWGHITCDGSVANIESAWAARNARYAGAAMAAALKRDPALKPAEGLTLRRGDGRKMRLTEMSPWDLMNLPLAEVLGLAPRITKAFGIDPAVIEAALARTSVQARGIANFHRHDLGDVPPPVLMVPQTAHYSWPKAMAILGLGEEALIRIPVDADGRMELAALKDKLGHCLQRQQPVMQVTAVIGSTEESAVDPLEGIVELRDEFRAQGLEFSVHGDAAWGGYFASLLRERALPLSDIAGAWDGLHHRPRGGKPALMFSDYVERQFRALARTDTITVDPHKAGFIPYPAGALCYRDGAMRDLISFKAPVVYHGDVDPTVGVYGVEGSRPGAAAAAVYLSHRVIRPDRSGYGDLLSRCIFNSKRFFAAISTLEAPEFTVTTFQRLASERNGGSAGEVAVERSRLARLAALDDQALIEALDGDPSLLDYFRGLGPDLMITAYAFNFVTADGLNRDAALMNEMNDAIYRALSLQKYNGGEIPQTPMFVTSSDFDPKDYGAAFVADFAARAGVKIADDTAINFLISTVQNPWLAEAGDKGMIGKLMTILSETARTAARKVISERGLAPPPSLPAAP